MVIAKWGCSSTGRARVLQARGRRFDPDQFHQINAGIAQLARVSAFQAGC